MAALTITSITTSNGTIIEPPPTGVLCVVGGNNVGKSQFLREIPAHIRDINGQFPSVLINSVSFDIDRDVLNTEEWLPLNSLEPEATSGEIRYRAPGGQQGVSVFNFKTLMSQAPKPHIGPLIDWFVRSLNAAERSSIGTMQIGSGSIRERSSAMHMLFRDGSLEASLSNLCEKAFGFPLTLDRVNGNVMLRIGKPSCASPSLQYPTLEYADAVRNLPSLNDQGDGVKNYLGMVLHMMT